MHGNGKHSCIGGNWRKVPDRRCKDALVREREKAKARRVAKRRNRAMAKLALVAATAVMTYMTITGKIEDPYGVLFSVALSLLLGAQVRCLSTLPK